MNVAPLYVSVFSVQHSMREGTVSVAPLCVSVCSVHHGIRGGTVNVAPLCVRSYRLDNLQSQLLFKVLFSPGVGILISMQISAPVSIYLKDKLQKETKCKLSL